MKNTIKSLAGTRKGIAEVKAKIDRLNEAISLSPLGERVAKATDLLRQLQEDAKYYRESIDEMAETYYLSTKDKHPHAAVTVKVGKEFTYDEFDAVVWAINTKQMQLLSIKKTAFEKIPRAGVEIPCVTVKEKISTSVKSDLNEYL